MIRLWFLALVIFFAVPLTGSWATAVPCPPTGNNMVCQITMNTAAVTNSDTYVTYAWNSAMTGTKSLTITPTCNSSTLNFIVKDEIGTAGTYPILVYPTIGNTIENTYTATTPFALNSNFESITFLCDGAGNWIVE
jgi:hypothetical protein